MFVFVYSNTIISNQKHANKKNGFKKLILHLMFSSAALHNYSLVSPCSAAPLLRITKHINMLAYNYTLSAVVVIFTLGSTNLHH